MEMHGLSPYAKFHFDNLYTVFKNKVTGRIEQKTTVFFRHINDPEKLRKITAGTDPDYSHVDKTGCKNGQIVDFMAYESYYEQRTQKF